MGKTYPRVIELLKKEFEERGISKYKFCKETGINTTSVERYLWGISEPNQRSLEKLSNYFGVSTSWLRGDSWWPYELERKRFQVLGNDRDHGSAENELIRNTAWERDAELAGLIGNLSDEEIEKAKIFFDQFPDLINLFCTIRPTEMDDAIEALQFFKKHFQAKIYLPQSEL